MVSPFPLKVTVFVVLELIICGIIICSLNGPEPVNTLNTTGPAIPHDMAATAAVKLG